MGGDTYDFLKLPNGRLMVTIGDVAGHGVGPALLMAATQALVRREAIEVGEHPEKVLQRLNHYLADTLDGVRFLTMTIAVWDAASKSSEVRPVEVGLTNNVMAEIRSGLEEGDLVVVSGGSAAASAATSAGNTRSLLSGGGPVGGPPL